MVDHAINYLEDCMVSHRRAALEVQALAPVLPVSKLQIDFLCANMYVQDVRYVLVRMRKVYGIDRY